MAEALRLARWRASFMSLATLAIMLAIEATSFGEYW